MNNQRIDKKLGKSVSSFIEMTNFIVTEKFVYTTELSRILLVGEPRGFGTIRYIPLINVVMTGPLLIFNTLFNNRFFTGRFEKFIKNSEKYSQAQLQEAIEDAVVLTTYNTNAFSVSRLLDYLSNALESKVGYIKEQIKYDSKWDHKSFSALKKWGALAAGLMAFILVNQGIGCIGGSASTIENIRGFAALGLIFASYQTVKNCYKILTINPNANAEALGKYEELLLFVQKLKEQLKINGFIAFTFRNGHTATIANDMFNTVKIS